MRLRRVLRVLLCVRTKHLVRTPFLLIRHRVVQVLESQNELLQMPGVDLGHLLVRLHVLHRVHRLELLCAKNQGLIHLAGVLAHHGSELIPSLLLAGSYAQLGVQFADAALDPLRGGLAGSRALSDR